MNIKKLLSLPAFLLCAAIIIARWYVNASGLAASPSDLNALIGALKMLGDFLHSWIFTPPVWFIIVVWSLAGVSYALWLFGDERLIRFTRMLSKKERRISEYKAFADTECVRLLVEEQIAKKVITTARWTIPPLDLPGFKSQEQACARAHHDEVYYDGYGLPEGYIETIIEQLKGMNSISGSSAIDSYRERIRIAQNAARENNLDWAGYEDGAFFPTPEMRRIWHGRRAGIGEANRILIEIKNQLSRYEGQWESAVSEEMRAELFKEIGDGSADT